MPESSVLSIFRGALKQQQTLETAFQTYLDGLWRYSQDLQVDAISCTTGGPCRYGKPYNLRLVTPSKYDVWLLRDISMRKVVPRWAKECDRIRPDCFKEWRRKVGPLVLSHQANSASK